jgi:hypothetical protein
MLPVTASAHNGLSCARSIRPCTRSCTRQTILKNELSQDARIMQLEKENERLRAENLRLQNANKRLQKTLSTLQSQTIAKPRLKLTEEGDDSDDDLCANLTTCSKITICALAIVGCYFFPPPTMEFLPSLDKYILQRLIKLVQG